MSTNVINQTPYLRTSREFPEELHQLAVEVNKSYVDIANAVNNRTISIFPTSRPAINGESWFITNNQRQQGFRQVFYITSSASFNHNLNWNSIQFFTKIYGIFYDGTNYYPVPFVNNTATGQVELYVSPTQVVIQFGGGAPPGFVSGIIILEWISKV